MPIAIKVDEDLPREVVQRLRDAGHDALSVVEQNHAGVSDEELWPIVQQESRCLFTADKGFADARFRLPGTHGGIVLFRLPRESRTGYIRLVDFFLREFVLDQVLGKIIIVTPSAIRIHRS